MISKCTTDTIEPLNITIKGTSLCTNEIGAHESYNVFAIDGDVEADLNMLAALAPATVTNISVASFSPPTTTVSLTGLTHSVVYFTLHVWSYFNAAVTPTTTMITTVESDNIIVAIVAGECRYIKKFCLTVFNLTSRSYWCSSNYISASHHHSHSHSHCCTAIQENPES